MIECRRIKEYDVPAVVAFAIAGMQADRYPLVLDEKKITHWVRQFLPDEALHFGCAAFNGGALVGSIACYVTELPFFERYEGSVVQCRSIEAGVGRRLIRYLKEWADAAMYVRRVVFPLEENADPRMPMLLRHFGFTREQTNLIYYKG